MPNYRVRWGQLFYERFNPGEAQKLYEEALSIDPKNANALLGEAQIMARRFDAKASDLAPRRSNPTRSFTRRTN